MKIFKAFGTVAFTVLTLALTAHGQTTAGQGKVATSGKAVDVGAIVRAFTAKETEFRRALNGYTFKRDAVIQTIGAGDQITGEYRRTSQFVFDDAGQRFER
ncbi:MAG TPA: hypothetical protein VE713_20115, partial [Pyrinomonadaceae bacterium]|nr:hypothetical protein [Pyrinomonadaceae bacterium]